MEEVVSTQCLRHGGSEETGDLSPGLPSLPSLEELGEEEGFVEETGYPRGRDKMADGTGQERPDLLPEWDESAEYRRRKSVKMVTFARDYPQSKTGEVGEDEGVTGETNYPRVDGEEEGSDKMADDTEPEEPNLLPEWDEMADYCRRGMARGSSVAIRLERRDAWQKSNVG